MASYRDRNEAEIDALCKPVPLATAAARVDRSKRTIDRWIKAGHLRVIQLQNPPEKAVILRELLETDKTMRDALAASRAAIAANTRRTPRNPPRPAEPTS